MKPRGLRFLLPLLLLALFYGGYVVTPLAALLESSLSADGGGAWERWRALFDPSNAAAMEAVRNSVGVSLASVVLSAVVGTLLAFAFTHCEFPGRRVLARLAVLPVAMPPLVGVIAFLFVFGEGGVLPRLAHAVAGIPPEAVALEGLPAVVAVHVYSFFVIFLLFVSGALARLDASALEAAASLGAGPGRTFVRIVLPSLRPALAGAALLTFMASMASFTAPMVFAGDRRFMTLQITVAKTNGDMPSAAAMALALALVSAAFFLLLRSSGGGPAPRTKGVVRPGRLALPRAVRTALAAAAVIAVGLCLLPVLMLLVISFAREGSWTTQLLPGEYTVENYRRLFGDPAVFEPLGNSLLMSAMALAGALVVGVTAAYMVVKGPLRRWRGSADAALTLPYAIPGTVLAVALILAFSTPGIFGGGAVLVGTFAILPLAYLLRTYPLLLRSTAAALDAVDDSLLEAAESLGAGEWRRFRTVVLPLVAGGIAAGATLVLIASLGEFVASILLYTYASRPVSVEILSQLRAFNFGGAAAYAVILLGVMLLLVSAGARAERTAAGGLGPFSG